MKNSSFRVAADASASGPESPASNPRAVDLASVPGADCSAHVVAAALFDAQGRVLIAQRPPGKHMAGGWEFPGGKLEPGEDPFEGLQRELREELGVELHAAERLIAYEHAFADRKVFLDLWLIARFSGEPRPLEGQPLRWVSLADLDDVGLLEADAPMIPALREACGG